jgi:C1A family cysteine protease
MAFPIVRRLGRKPKTPGLHFGVPLAPEKAWLRPAIASYEYDYPAVYDQGQYGTCVTHGTGETLDFYAKKRHGSSTLVSRRAIYAQTKRSFEPDDLQDDGLLITDALKMITEFGWVDEAKWPYPPDNQEATMLAPVPEDLWNKTPTFASWVNVPQTPESMAQALWQHGPLIIGLSWANEWMSTLADGQLPTPVSDAGGHCVAIVGYNDAYPCHDGSKGAFKIRNSWGYGWGVRGDCWLPYSFAVYNDQNGGYWPDEVYAVSDPG